MPRLKSLQIKMQQAWCLPSLLLQRAMESKKGAVEKSKTSVGREAKQGDITTVGYCITCTGMSKDKGKLVI